MNRRLFLEQATQAIALLVTSTALPAQPTSTELLPGSSTSTSNPGTSKPETSSASKVSELPEDENALKTHKNHRKKQKKKQEEMKLKHKQGKAKVAKHRQKTDSVDI